MNFNVTALKYQYNLLQSLFFLFNILINTIDVGNPAYHPKIILEVAKGPINNDANDILEKNNVFVIPDPLQLS